jgi:LPS-assembly protein
MRSEGNSVRADRIVWNRRTGEVRAEGNVRVVNPAGDAAYGETVVLTDTLRDGAVRNLLLVLEDGGRLAAERGERENGYTTLYRAAYSPCNVVNSEGCPKDPTWTITAVKVVHDPVRNRINYDGASLNLFGARIIPCPGFRTPTDRAEGRAGCWSRSCRSAEATAWRSPSPTS